MKRVSILITLLFAVSVFAAGKIEKESFVDRRASNPSYLMGGEHTPVVWKDIFKADNRTNANDSICSPWICIQYDQNASGDSADAQKFIWETAPSVFNLHLRGRLFNTAAENSDTVWLGRARFEIAIDTTRMRELAPDTSSTFVKDGNSSRPDYGIWTFEDPLTTGDSMAFVYPLRVWGGKYLRIWLVVINTNDSAYWDGDLEAPSGGR